MIIFVFVCTLFHCIPKYLENLVELFLVYESSNLADIVNAETNKFTCEYPCNVCFTCDCIGDSRVYTLSNRLSLQKVV